MDKGARSTDEWRPTATIENLKARALLFAKVREFFAARHVWEVETPILSMAGATDVNLSSITAHYAGPSAPQGRAFYLHTSPEFAMKRLLAAGSGAIYQICKVFRNGEEGRLHNPEFTMLEWYRPGFDDNDLMIEMSQLLHCLGILTQPEKMTYRAAFQKYAGLDPFHAPIEILQAKASSCGLMQTGTEHITDRDTLLNFLITSLVEPNLGLTTPTFLYHYPPTQAALARIDDNSDPPVARRFELYMHGIEIANGYYELVDGIEQRKRMLEDLAIRRRLQLPSIPVDEKLLAALASGLPKCAGVALGLDRLCMVLLNKHSIDDVISFPIARS